MNFRDKFQSAHKKAVAAQKAEADRLASLKAYDAEQAQKRRDNATALHSHLAQHEDLLSEHGWRLSLAADAVVLQRHGELLRVLATTTSYRIYRSQPNAMRLQDQSSQYVAEKTTIAEIEDYLIPVLASPSR